MDVTTASTIGLSKWTPLHVIAINLEQLQRNLMAFHKPNQLYGFPTKEEVLLRIEGYVQLIVGAIAAGEWPQLPIYNSKEILSWRMAKQKRRGLLLFHLLAKVHSLLRTNTSSTKRDIYYEDVALWTNQTVLDDVVTQVSRLLSVPRHCLNIHATSKGLVAGSLSFLDPHRKLIDCQTPTGMLIPNEVDQLSDLRSNARCILVVEKDSTFQKLIDEQIHHFIGPCILITGKGYPDVTTRRFIRRLWDDLRLPPLALMDADPHGISIMAVYRFGSQQLDDMEHLATPQMRWLGIHPSDMETLKLPIESKLALTSRDRSLIDSMAKRPIFAENQLLHDQLEKQRQLDCKVEIQGLTKVHCQFLTRTYLPSKMQSTSWL